MSGTTGSGPSRPKHPYLLMVSETSTSASTSGSASTSKSQKIVWHDPCNLDYDFKSESDNPNYLSRFEAFNRDWTTWEMNNSETQRQIMKSIDTALQPEYRSIKEPKDLWDKINADIQEFIKLDGKYK
ncbi:hypothetical protein K440DRAFT_638185 [Wilcoxina mikolae CBS 423.85]|nr:hypothetical protein K440DRAFT_638185 [Wilcoxina mikolae CBS 423.85]